MRTLREWLRRIAGMFDRSRDDRDLEEELRSHFELAADAERRRGHGDAQARREARLRVGGVDQAMASLRDQRGVPLLNGLGQDLRLALRAFRATPLVSAVAISSLALAIGANTAIFSMGQNLALRSLPVRDPERLVHVTDSVRRATGEIRVRAWSHPFWEQIKERPRLFESATAWAFTRFNLASGGETQFVEGIWADGGFFETLGVRAVAGRTFSPRDDRPGGGDGPVAVIGYRYWMRQFGGSPSALGQVLRLNGVPFTIVGVTPPEFFGLEVGRSFDCIVPLRTEALVLGADSSLDSAATNFLNIVARLRPDQTLDGAAAALRAVQADVRQATLGPWDKAVADRYLTSPFTVLPARTGFSYLRERFAAPLLILGVVVILVLLIGCVNVANLLLARAFARRHELSIQAALGASRWRLGRQLFAESLALSVLGAASGIAMAVAISRFLIRQLSTPANVVFLDLPVDGRVLMFTLAVAVFTALLFGTAPALLAARAQPIDAIKEWGRGPTAAIRAGGPMTWLVAVQVALSTVLLGGAGLFVRSFASLANRDLGLQPDRVLVATVDGLRTKVAPPARLALYLRVREAVLQVPGVAGAAISHLTPIGGGGFSPPVAVSAPAGAIRPGDGEIVGNLISPGWFDIFGMQLVAGRDFSEDDRKGATSVAIVNEAFVKCCLRDGDPVGTIITVFPGTARALPLRIVGVVANAVYYSARESPPPTWFMPIGQFTVTGFPFASARLSVRASAASPALLTKNVADAATAVNPDLALTFRPLAEQVRGSLTMDRLMAQLAGFFGVLALLLAALGLYGVTAYAVSRRRSEIGIRVALGADPGRVIRFVLARVAIFVAVGAGAGIAISLSVSHFVAGLLYGLDPHDPPTLAGAAALLFVTGAVATWVPARRAARMDPGAVLRQG